MKLSILPIAFGCLVTLFLIPARAQFDASQSTNLVASQPEDLSLYDTADALWMHIDQRMPSTGGPQAVTMLSNQVAGAAEFERRYPDDPRNWGARLIAARANFALLNMRQGTMGLDAIQTELNSISSASDAPPEIQKGALSLLGQINYRKAEAKVIQIRALQKTDPSEAEAELASLLNDPDQGVKQLAQGEVLRRAAMAQPINLSFTAVDGSQVDLSMMRGKVVLIDFWATWCHPCMAEVPNVVAAYNQLHSDGFEVVGISLDQDREKLLSVTAEKGMVWPQYFDGLGWQNKISTSYGINAVPAMWLVNKQGMIVDTDGRTDLVDKIQKLLQE